MPEMSKTELVFIPSPGMGHLVAAVEMAKLLVDRNTHLSIRVIILKRPNDTMLDSYIKSLESDTNPNLLFLEFSDNDARKALNPSKNMFIQLVELHKQDIRDYVSGIVKTGSIKLAGFIVDMFCTTMIDVADEFGLPSYVFFTSSAGMLGLMLHLQSLRDDYKKDVTEYKDSGAELSVSTYINPVPAKVLPSVIFDKEGGNSFMDQVKRYRKTKGIIVNTFLELESHALKSLARANEEEMNIPPVYALGPILNVKGDNGDSEKGESIMKWLDDQPDSSVVFLCFGSMGAFDADQVKEIAYALERSGRRFLWSLRKPPPEGTLQVPSEYENLEEVLPEGFLKRTADVGKVIGWAPQAAVLSHTAVGGFVSHCGWNSTLESVWFGVPMAAWPMYAEQQINAFELVKDLGLAVEIKMDYFKDIRKRSPFLVKADQIEKGIRCLMEPESEIRRKVKEMKEKSRVALMEGGSSNAFLGRFIEDVIKNIP